MRCSLYAYGTSALATHSAGMMYCYAPMPALAHTVRGTGPAQRADYPTRVLPVQGRYLRRPEGNGPQARDGYGSGAMGANTFGVVYMMRCVQDEQEEDVKVSKASRVSRGAKAQTVASDGFIMPSVSVLATF